MTSPASGAQDIPLLLTQPPTVPPNADKNLGSQNYAKRPFAVVVGGGFDDSMFAQMKEACKNVEEVPWARADVTKAKEMPDYSDVDAFGRAVAGRIKTALDGLCESGEGVEKGGVVMY